MAVAEGKVGAPFNISIPSPSLWSPQNPHLYRVFATLHMDNTTTSLLAVRRLPAHLNTMFTPTSKHAQQ